MKVVIAHRDGDIRVVDLPEPIAGPGDVLLRVSHSALWLPEETDLLARVDAHLQPGEDGVPLGAMASGIVERVGEGVDGLKAGLRVAAFGRPFVYHGRFLRVPADRVIELPKKVNHEEGAFAGQGAAAVHAVRTAGAAMGSAIAVFGAGMLGILAAQAARAAGAGVLLADHFEARLTRARNVGVALACPLDGKALVKEVDTLTNGQGLDGAVLTADAAESASRLALHLLRPGGRLVVASPHARLHTDLVVEKELEVFGAMGAGPSAGSRWTVRANAEVFLALLSERKVQIASLVADRYPLERAAALYDKLLNAQPPAIGAVLTT